MKTITYLARQEFILPFKTLLKKSTPGGRDFFWLTVLMVLIFSCVLLLYSIKQGLTDRFVDVLLGAVPGAGIPVWIQPHPLGAKDVIDEGVIVQIGQYNKKLIASENNSLSTVKPLSVHPYSDIGKNYIALPDQENVWNNTEIRFKGIAVYEQDPLWQYAIKTDTPSLMRIVMSRSLVKEHFNYTFYLEALRQRLPVSLVDKVPQTLDAFLAEKNPTLWLSFGSHKDLLPIEINWVPRLPIPDNHVFLMPAKLLHALIFGGYRSSRNYFPEALVNNKPEAIGKRISRLAFTETIHTETQKKFSQCMGGGKFEMSSGYVYLILSRAKPEFWLNACTEQFQLQGTYRIEKFVSGDIIYESFGEGELECNIWPKELLNEEEQSQCQTDKHFLIQRDVPLLTAACYTIPSNDLSQAEQKLCREDRLYTVSRRLSDQVLPFTHAFLYVPDRNQLEEAMTMLEMLPGKPLFLTSTYQDSLNRFSALSQILSKLGEAFLWLASLFLLALLFIQLSTLVGHRRHAYGILLAKGMAHNDIYAILRLQLCYVVTISFSVAITLTFLIRRWVESQIIEIATRSRYNTVLTLPENNLLPLEWLDYLAVFFIGLIIFILLAYFILHRLPLKKGTAPEDLFNVA